MKKLLIWLVIMLPAWLTVSAQLPAIRNFGPQDYAGGTQNWTVAQTPAHYILVANNMALMAYNGDSWDAAWLPNHTNVHAVSVSADGRRLYAGGFGEFGYFENRTPLRRAPYVSLAALLPEQMRGFHDVWSATELGDGSVAFRTNHHIYLYTPPTARNPRVCLRRYTPGGKITYCGRVGDCLTVATTMGICRLEGQRMVRMAGSRRVGALDVRGAFAAPGKAGIVLVTHENGMLLWDAKGFHTYQGGALGDRLKGMRVFCVADNEAWTAVGTVSHGMVALEKRTGQVHHLDRTKGLRNNTVLNLLIDSDNNIWCALDNGLSYIIFDSPFRTLFTDSDGVGTGYASMPAGDRLYLGTNQSLYYIPLPGEEPGRIFTPTEVKGITGQIWTLTRAGDDLLCGADAGAFVVTGDRAMRIDGLEGTWGFRPLPGHSDTMIASLYTGFAIVRRTPAGWKVVNRIADAGEGTVNFEVDADGTVWYSHWLQGVFSFRLSDDLKRAVHKRTYNKQNQLPSDDNNLVAKVNGRVYISAADGFHRPDGNGRLMKAAWLDRLFPPHGATTRLTETPRGDLWAYSPDYLYFAKHSGGKYSVRRFHFQSTVRRLQMNLGNMSFMADGRTVMNQDDGFFLVDSDMSAPAGHRVSIDFVRPVQQKAAPDETFVYRNGMDADGFDVEGDNNSLYFEYSISEYRDRQPVRFSTWLEGYEKDWTAWTPLNYREINRIPPGDYVMHVKAHDTITGSVDSSAIAFSVKPEWYETWWARSLFALLTLGVALVLLELCKRMAYAYFERKRRARERRLRELEEKRRLRDANASMQQRTLELDKQIKQKSSQLADSDIHMQRKTDILRDIRTELEQILKMNPDGGAAPILTRVRSVMSMLKFHDASEATWERLEDNFNIIFDDLLKNLLERCPNLTRNDIKVCSYLRMNMSTKEIASLMNLSQRSVESTRYRLRKRLGMEPGQSFQEFFNTLGGGTKVSDDTVTED